MKSMLPVFLIIAALLVIGSFTVFSETRAPKTSSPEISVVPTIDNSDLKQGGSSYADPNGIYNIVYPADYKLDTNDPKHIRIYKTGATQKGQTEMYDGVLVVFENVNLGDKSLTEWVDDNIKTTTSDGTLSVTEPKTPVTINGYPGITYATRGLGEAKYYVLQKNPNSKNVVVITTAVNDPQNVGYQTEVNKILSTINLLK